MSIVYFSIDYDGCLASRKQKPTEEHFTKGHHNGLMQQIKKLTVNRPLTLFVGSNRQSQSINNGNKLYYNNGSVFDVIPMVASLLTEEPFRLQANMDPFLLADIVPGRKNGDEFSEVSSSDHINFGDESKVLLLYAQMHKAATDNPNEEIHLHFIDDKEKILYALCDFYNNNKYLIPPNVTLHLHFYKPNLFFAHPNTGEKRFNLEIWPSNISYPLMPSVISGNSASVTDENFKLTVLHVFNNNNNSHKAHEKIIHLKQVDANTFVSNVNPYHLLESRNKDIAKLLAKMEKDTGVEKPASPIHFFAQSDRTVSKCEMVSSEHAPGL